MPVDEGDEDVVRPSRRERPVVIAALALAALTCSALVPAAGRRPPPGSMLPRVLSYGLDLTLAPKTGRIAGRVTIRLRRPAESSSDPAAAIRLDLIDALDARRVTLDGEPATFTHSGDVLTIRPPGTRPSRANQEGPEALVVEYAGVPGAKALSSQTRAGRTWVASYGLPYSARQWWPAFDTPAVKAQAADIFVTVPAGMSAVSNGRFVGVDAAGGGRLRFHWHESHPIYADVISIAAGPYVRVERRYRSLTGREVPLEYFFFPPDRARGEQTLAIIPEILHTYERLFGPYPFADEKYGIAEVAYPSFREHQTIPSLGQGLLTGNAPIWNVGNLSDVLAHDLAHQWFGNSLTMTSWSDAWLNEGFATFATALWREQHLGKAAYEAYLKQLSRDDWEDPVHVADPHNLGRVLSTTTFNKGAVALAALRRVMGDRAFFQALRAYVRANRGGHVTTAMWEQACEQAYGKSLKTFFETWTLLP